MLAFGRHGHDASTDPALDAAIRAIPSWEGEELEILPIAEGRTNRNFRVEVGDEAFFLRLSEKTTELLGIDRVTETRRPWPPPPRGSGPRSSPTCPTSAASSRSGSHGEPLSEGDLERRTVLAAVVRVVKAIHAGPASPTSFDPFRIVEEYRHVSEERGVAIPAAYEPAHAARRTDRGGVRPSDPLRCARATTTCSPPTSSRRRRVLVVDYEYAGMGDPFFDLGNLRSTTGFDDGADERCSSCYFGEPTDAHRARLKLMRIMSDFREAMWGVMQQAISTLDIDYVAYADEHFERLLANDGGRAVRRAGSSDGRGVADRA